MLDRLYDGINEGNENTKPTRTMRNELRLLCRLSPLIRVDLRKSFSGIIITIDASLEGGAVVYVKVSPDVARRVTGMNLKKREEWTDGIKCQTCIQH